MNALVRAEVLKIRTLRSFWWSALAVLVTVPFLMAAAIAVTDDVDGRLNTAAGVRNVFSAASSGLMLIIGILVMAGGVRHNNPAAAIFLAPNPPRVGRGELIAGGLVGFVFWAPAC